MMKHHPAKKTIFAKIEDEWGLVSHFSLATLQTNELLMVEFDGTIFVQLLHTEILIAKLNGR